MPKLPLLRFLAREVREMIPPTLFFAAGFNLLVLTGHLVVAGYGQALFNYMVATTSALIVGKSVLLANALPLLRRFDGAPLIVPILFKTLVYCSVVMLVRLLEAVVEHWIASGSPTGTFAHLREGFAWNRFVAIQLWIFVLFLVYTSASELDDLFGEGELARVFFTHSARDLQLNRRARMRSLAQINRLTREHDAATLRDPGTAAHKALFGKLEALAARRVPDGSAGKG
jgi:hypothetical protein